MKSKINIKSIAIMAVIGIISLFFINMSLAANNGTINVETANLRETADENSKILELLSMNEEVEIIEKTGNWYQVKAKGIIGYLRQDLITVNGEETEENTTLNETSTEVLTEEKQETTPIEPTTQKEKKDIELGTYKVVENTKLKIVPVINATDIIEVKKDEEVNVIEIVNGWVCVETQTTKGWIRKEKLQTEEQQLEQAEETIQEQQEETEQTPTVIKTLFINTTTVNLRKEANTTSEVVASLPLNTAVDVIAELDGWYQVKVSGKEGYISSSLLSTTKQETSRSSTVPRTSTQETITDSTSYGNGSAVVATAQQYIGCKYVYGGTTPSGFDCSGFTSHIYKLYGVTLSRTAAAQYSNGVAVSRSDLQPGDLVMFGTSGINHVAIYVGGGMIVHAANSSRGVTTDTINSGYYNANYVGARRVI